MNVIHTYTTNFHEFVIEQIRVLEDALPEDFILTANHMNENVVIFGNGAQTTFTYDIGNGETYVEKMLRLYEHLFNAFNIQVIK